MARAVEAGGMLTMLEESIGPIDWKQGYYDSMLSDELPHMSNLVARIDAKLGEE